ncbi:uncharacterized protein EI90DRAFT_3076385 [Cantharellus anzutake]|uniref:uncharacterized protein n=1 Tax=Cantharellus anzutake TaxID=1750568 RepID=UPI001905EC7A|nr:uncharacterized protein EI90DRAFT_3076385 [Cantharellus anzutake]KAF8324222.1 hypothetical protein EI90DRAFT_3076385 [Cantharellus anzutake]
MAATLDSERHEKTSFDGDLPSDEQHELDSAILKRLGTKPSLHILLFVITNDDPRLKSLTLQEAKDLISGHPYMVDMLQNSLEARSFREVQRLEVLWPAGAHYEPQLSDREMWRQSLTMSTEELRAMLESSFRRNYRGDMPQIFLQALNAYGEMYNADAHYGHSIPILQSSATGKSRLVAEVLKKVPGISICFRNSNRPEAGWPPRDEAMCRWVESKSTERCLGEEIAAALLGALFKEACEGLGRNPDEDVEIQMGAWARASALRGACFESVLEEAYRSLTTLPGHLVARRQRIIVENDLRGVGEWRKELYRHFCLEPAKNLAVDLQRLKHDKFIIAFDECTNMGSTREPAVRTNPRSLSPAYGMSLLALLRMIKAQDEFPIDKFNFWFLFLDTDPMVAQFFDACLEVPSVRDTRLMMLGPWVRLGFDVMVESSAKTPGDALLYNHLIRYGRPYWSTYDSISFIAVTKHKLYMRSGTPYLDPSTGSILAAEGVRSHMRILKNVIDPSLIKTVTPSEPPLAIAAMKELMTSREAYKKALNTLVNEVIINESILERGYENELFSRVLLTLARDWASRFSRLLQVPVVSASVFLTTLLGENLGLLPNDRGHQLLKEMDDTHINFTHIFQLTDDIDNLSFDFLRNAWCRGAAFLCKSKQPCIDGFIVTYSGSLDDPFELEGFSYIAWRSKLRVDKSTSTIPLELAGPQIEGRKPQSAVLLFMDLGNNSRFGSAEGQLCQLTFEPARHPDVPERRWEGYMPTQEEEPPRWCIHARGHTCATYPLIEEVEPELTTLLNRSLRWADREAFSHFASAMRAQLDPFRHVAKTHNPIVE